MKRIIYLIKLTFFLLPVSLAAQNNSGNEVGEDSLRVYQGGEKYPVQLFEHDFKGNTPKNIILMIGDGMGTTQVFAGLVANGGRLFIENFKHIGFSKTQSKSSFTTDSGAGATALATGSKSYNGAISMGVTENGDTVALKTSLEIAEEKGLSTGMVASCAASHATPAAFIAHQPSRHRYDDIAADYLKTDIEVFIGGGYKNFIDRKDGRNLFNTLEEKGYRVLQDMDEIAKVKEGKLFGLTAYAQNLPAGERNLDLAVAAETAINILKQNEKGFFMMVEGSQIDWGAHQNNTAYMVREMLDFDKAIGKALEFASQDKETLVVVTADHETGGLTILDGDMEKGMVHGAYSTGGHTGVMVPVFAYGPGADQFTGIIDNTNIGKKIIAFLSNR